jgi:hypothetical protein
MLLDTSSKAIFIVNDAMSMIVLRIGSNKVAKARSASRMAHDISDRGSLMSGEKSSVSRVLLSILMLRLRVRDERLMI